MGRRKSRERLLAEPLVLSEYNALVYFGAGKLGKEFANLFRAYQYACNVEDAESEDYKRWWAISSCLLRSLKDLVTYLERLVSRSEQGLPEPDLTVAPVNPGP